MNYHTKHLTFIATIVIFCAPINTSIIYESTQEKHKKALNTYDAIIERWKPLLQEVSQQSMIAMQVKLNAQLREAFRYALNYLQEEDIQSLIDELETYPACFVCKELAKDIETLVNLKNQEALFNHAPIIDINPLVLTLMAIEKLVGL